jgi:3-oxoacyl-[acyl-carrier protein] reductase
MKRFENQSAIITGGAEGLGRGIAERIASEGGKVFLFDINQPMLEKTIQEFKNKGFEVEGLLVDVSSESSVVDAIRKVGEKARAGSYYGECCGHSGFIRYKNYRLSC